MRAVFTLKYNFKDQRPNPYKSQLTEKASFLIDALERKAHIAMRSAECLDYEKGLDGMGVTSELASDVHSHTPKEKRTEYEIGE